MAFFDLKNHGMENLSCNNHVLGEEWLDLLNYFKQQINVCSFHSIHFFVKKYYTNSDCCDFILFFYFFALYHNRINKKNLENLNKRYKWDAIDHAPFHYAWHNSYDNHGG